MATYTYPARYDSADEQDDAARRDLDLLLGSARSYPELLVPMTALLCAAPGMEHMTLVIRCAAAVAPDVAFDDMPNSDRLDLLLAATALTAAIQAGLSAEQARTTVHVLLDRGAEYTSAVRSLRPSPGDVQAWCASGWPTGDALRTLAALRHPSHGRSR